MLVGVINVDGNWLVDALMVMNCKIGQILFIYLGLPIGGNPRCHSLWLSLIEKIKMLFGWKSHFFINVWSLSFAQICLVIIVSLLSFLL
jgi:hypothetical protein